MIQLATLWILALLASLRPEPLPARSDSPAWKEMWSQSRGVCTGTSAVDVAPVMSLPSEAWRVAFTSIDSEPVAWGGTMYVVGTQRQGRRLYAHDVRTGERVATSSPLSGKGRVHLAMWQGHVAVVEEEAISIFAARSNQLAPKPKIAGSWPAPPCVYEGYLFINNANFELCCIDMRSAKIIARVRGGFGRPAVITEGKRRNASVVTVGMMDDDERGRAVLFIQDLGQVGKKDFHLAVRTPQVYFSFARRDLGAFEMAALTIARVETSVDDEQGTWFVHSPIPFLGEKDVRYRTAMLPKYISPFDTEPVIAADAALGFSSRGALIAFRSNGAHREVLAKDALIPEGARRGKASSARGVVYFENWAVEIESGRVLWCDPKLAPVTQLFPLADGHVVYVTADHHLVALTDSSRDAAPTATSGATVASARTLTAPGSGDGVVLSDGRRIAGKITELADGSVRVDSTSGSPETFAASEIALIENAEKARLLGEQYAVYQACWAVLRARFLESLEKRFEDYRKNGFVEDCRRILSEAREYGIDTAHATAMERRLGAGMVNTNSNASGQRAYYAKEEAKLREKSFAEWMKSSDWCREKGFALTASAILWHADRLMPGNATLQSKATSLVPPGFESAGPAGWLALAAAILPVGGSVLAPDDAAWERAKDPPWNEGVLGLRTENLLFLSLERDSAVMGSCLRRGEMAVRVLESLLPASAPEASRTALEPLELRLHHDRAAYLAEFSEQERAAMEWTAGFYSPRLNTSWFYVPRNEATKDPLERDLDHVLVHEITHHYISDRWLRKERGAAAAGEYERAGFWVVEGFARFIEDQVVEMEHRGDQLVDETVMSIDAAARISEAEHLIPMAEFLDLSQERFHRISNNPVGWIQLRSTIARLNLTWKSIFYEQAGSLVFYLMNRAGPEKRKLLLEYLRAWYDGRIEKESWKSLGYETADELEKAYVSFLAERGH